MIMSPIRRNFFLLVLAMLALGHWFAPSASAQVLVYRMSLEQIQNMNLDFYTGGYFVVPSDGGQGSFIFTKKGKGEKTFVTTGTGTLFIGITENGVRKAVVRAGTTGTGVAKSSFMAYGSADQMTRLSTPALHYFTEIAPRLFGEALASSTAADPATPKEIGFGGIFEWRLVWDKKQTDAANKTGSTVAETITTLETMLEDQGYNAEEAPALVITTTSPLPAATQGSFYTQTLTSNGGSGAKTWAVSLDAPPAGIELSPAGVLSGTPSTTDSATFTVKVTDNSGASTTKVFSMAVGAPALAITTTSLDDAIANTLYGEPITSTGGVGDKTWEIIAGELPLGLTLTPGNGIIVGTTSELGTKNFTVKVTDSASTPATATKNLTITVTAAP